MGSTRAPSQGRDGGQLVAFSFSFILLMHETAKSLFRECVSMIYLRTRPRMMSALSRSRSPVNFGISILAVQYSYDDLVLALAAPDFFATSGSRIGLFFFILVLAFPELLIRCAAVFLEYDPFL